MLRRMSSSGSVSSRLIVKGVLVRMMEEILELVKRHLDVESQDILTYESVTLMAEELRDVLPEAKYRKLTESDCILTTLEVE